MTVKDNSAILRSFADQQGWSLDYLHGLSRLILSHARILRFEAKLNQPADIHRAEDPGLQLKECVPGSEASDTCRSGNDDLSEATIRVGTPITSYRQYLERVAQAAQNGSEATGLDFHEGARKAYMDALEKLDRFSAEESAQPRQENSGALQ